MGISIHALREEGDLRCPPTPSPTSNFYPRPPRGGRPIMATTQLRSSNFYPRPPRGGRRFKRDYSLLTTIFLSTPSARRATTQQDTPQKRYTISIHALREEGDRAVCRRPTRSIYFYPRPPRGGRQELTEKLTLTPDFYPRPPRGGRLKVPWYRSFFTVISIHALREEGDVDRAVVLRALAEFLSTPSARRATPGFRRSIHNHLISIHALREEGDRLYRHWLTDRKEFLSTPSARRATHQKHQGRRQA